MSDAHPRCAARRSRPAGAALVALAMALAGCQTGGTSALTRWRMALDPSVGPSLNKDPSDDRGLMARWINPKAPKPTDPNGSPDLVMGPNGLSMTKVKPNPAAEADVAAAEKLRDQGKLPEAETALAQAAKKWKDSPWGERAQFLLAETQYQRGKLVAAHESYEKLRADYQSTKYRDQLVAREFAIGEKWIAQYDPKAKPEQKMAWYDRFNGTRPLVDTNGHAVAAFEHVRNNDPGGPLSDDAAMKIADYYYAVGDFESASTYYDQLITENPKSPLVGRAQLASIDAKLKAYLGPDYDGTGLEQARETVKKTLVMFPERQASTTEKLYRTLDLITDQEAERDFHTAEFYSKIGKVPSAEYYYSKVTHKYPNSAWAGKAKTQLAQLAKLPRTESRPSKMLLPGVLTDPFSGGSGGMNNMMGGMGAMGGMGGMMGPGQAGMY